MAAAAELAATVGAVVACHALGVPRASLYRQRRLPTRAAAPRPHPARALTAPERQTVLDLLHSERFVDQAPTEVYATLQRPLQLASSVTGLTMESILLS